MDWDKWFMGFAQHTALKSKDPNTQVGSCIVKGKHIISVGYNGFVNTPGFDNDKVFPWTKPEKYFYIVHSEANSILNAHQDIRGCVLYTTLYPCNECAKLIVQSGIVEVIYLENKYANTESVRISTEIMNYGGVKIRDINS